MKGLLCYALIFSVAFAASGCWDANEIEDIGISTAMAIDMTPDGSIKVTLQILNPSNISPTGGGVGGGGSAGGNTYWNVSGTGENITQAISRITNNLPRHLYLAQNNIIIIGENLARNGMGNLIDYFVREPTMRLTNYIFISKGDASDILSIQPNLDKLLSQEILESIITTAIKNTAPSQLKDIAACFLGPSSSFVTTKIEGTPKTPQFVGKSQIDQTNPETNKQINMQGLAVIKEGKLVGFLTQHESYGYMLIANKAPRILINIRCDDGKTNIGVDMFRASTSTKPEIVDGNLVYNINVKAEGNITEVRCNVNFTEEKNIEKINRQVEKELEDHILVTVKHAQELNSDFLYFLEIFHRSYPKEYKTYKDSWDEIFPNIKLNIKVDFNVRRYGINMQPIQE